jgi:hypothetical protein
MTARLWTAIAAITLSLASLAGCSSDEPKPSTSGDPPGEPKPTGAINMEVYATETQSCPPGNVQIDVGTVNSSPPETVVDGKDGAKVSCSVAPSGGKFNASGSIEKGSLSFAFRDVVTGGMSAVGQVEFSDPAAGVRYASTLDKPCVFQFAPGSDQGVEAGRIFVQFDCATLASAADPLDVCSARYGYVLLENCVF